MRRAPTDGLSARRRSGAGAAPRVSAALDAVAEGVRIVVCAWCGGLRPVDGGAWLVQPLRRGADRSRVTHGLCPACEARRFPPSGGTAG
jgi:hypothetical protein